MVDRQRQAPGDVYGWQSAQGQRRDDRREEWWGWHPIRNSKLIFGRLMFDRKCYDLAADCLEDCGALNTQNNRHALAQEIQDTIENFIGLKEYEQRERSKHSGGNTKSSGGGSPG